MEHGAASGVVARRELRTGDFLGIEVLGQQVPRQRGDDPPHVVGNLAAELMA
jgi:hypothetical protein